MSFAVWSAKPPFEESTLNEGEKIYQVGAKWVVTDQGQPSQKQIDAVLNMPAQRILTDGALANFLVQQKVITQAALDGVLQSAADSPV